MLPMNSSSICIAHTPVTSVAGTVFKFVYDLTFQKQKQINSRETV